MLKPKGCLSARLRERRSRPGRWRLAPCRSQLTAARATRSEAVNKASRHGTPRWRFVFPKPKGRGARQFDGLGLLFAQAAPVTTLFAKIAGPKQRRLCLIAAGTCFCALPGERCRRHHPLPVASRPPSRVARADGAPSVVRESGRMAGGGAGPPAGLARRIVQTAVSRAAC